MFMQQSYLARKHTISSSPPSSCSSSSKPTFGSAISLRSRPSSEPLMDFKLKYLDARWKSWDNFRKIKSPFVIWEIFRHTCWQTVKSQDLFLERTGKLKWSKQRSTLITNHVRLHSKSHQKSSKCQNLPRVWHLIIFRADQSKKPHCMCIIGTPSKTT